MKRIENDLKNALRRKPPPPGFTAKVLGRLEKDASPWFPRLLRSRRSWIIAATATLALVVFAGVSEHQRQVRSRNEEALQRTLSAISITTEQLSRAESIAFRSTRWERLSKHLIEFQESDAN